MNRKANGKGLPLVALVLAASSCGSEAAPGELTAERIDDERRGESPSWSSSPAPSAEVPSSIVASTSSEVSALLARPGISWVQRGKPFDADRIAGCRDGSLYALNYDKTLWRNTAGGVDNGWVKIGSAGAAMDLSCTDRLWAFNTDRSLWRNDGTATAPSWTRVGRPTGAKQVTAGFWIGLHQNAVAGLFALNDDNSLWQSTTGADGSWSRIGQPKSAARVEAGISGMWALNADKTLWRGNGTDGGWVQIDKPFAARLVSDDGSLKTGAIWALNTDQTLWRGVVNGGMEGEACRPPCYGANILLALTCDRCDSGLACGSAGRCVQAGGYMQPCNEPATITSGPSCDPGLGLSCAGGLCRRTGTPGEPCLADGTCHGDIVCAPNNSCVSPVVATTSCAATSRDCNVCANDVPRQFRAIFKEGRRTKTSYSWKFNYGDSFVPSGMKPNQPFDDADVVQRTHFQSFVHTNDVNYPYAGTHSDDKDGVMFIVRQSPDQKRLDSLHRTRTVHPAGMQALGQFLVYGDGPDLRVHDMTSSRTAQSRTLALPAPGLGEAGDGLGAVKLSSGDTLLVVGPENNNRNTAWRFYFAAGSIATTNQVRFIAEATSANWGNFIDMSRVPPPFDIQVDPDETNPLSSENLSVIPECGSGNIYIINSIGDDDINPSDGLWRLSRLQFVNDRMLVTPVDYAFVGQDLGTCHMRSSATVWTEPSGKMRFYCHQRMVRQGIFEGSESVAFTGFSESTTSPPPPPPPGGSCCSVRADGTCEIYAPPGGECP
jgi:hypothetical protein